MVGGAGAVGNVICSICYEDLKPAVEDLQAISVCGHVFHELCLQQWFEYCSNKKNSCPVCKQSCTLKQAGRLYFQSVGDHNTDTQKTRSGGGHECPELQNEVQRLELKVTALTSTLEHQQKSLKDVNEELCTYKDLAKKEAALKVEALQQQALLQQSLQCKSEDLNRSTAACSKLQERNIALAKELASIKLVTDLDLKEDEALKLASLGNGGNLMDTIDILRNSLVIRNKSYKELMIKCNLLGRGEARSNMKLEKAMGKISKLQTRVQQLERDIENKENDTMRGVRKASVLSMRKMDMDGVSHLISMLPKKKKLCDTPHEKFSEEHLGKVENDSLHCTDEYSHSSKNTSLSNKTESFIMIEDDYISVLDKRDRSDLSKPNSIGTKTSCHENKSLVNDSDAFIKSDSKDANLQFDDIVQVQPSVHLRNENSIPSTFRQPVTDQLYSSTLVGSDGLNRTIGKWCKKGQRVESNPVAYSMQKGTKTATGSLISVGADGRGGKIKVLKSLNQSLDTRAGSSIGVKRQKQGTKTSSNNVQSNGCLQIEHFFGKSG